MSENDQVPPSEETGGVTGNGAASPDLEALGAPPPPSTGPRMLVPLFVVPLLIVAVIVGIVLGVQALMGGQDTLEDLVGRVESGGVNDRWQAAADLADRVLREPDSMRQDPGLLERLRRAFGSSRVKDHELRAYLALLFATVDDRAAGPLLLDALRRSIDLRGGDGSESGNVDREELDREVLEYVQALGRLQETAALPVLGELAQDTDAAHRKVAALALGDLYLGGAEAPPEAVALLATLHADDDPWVRMNAALSFAKLGREEGLPTLERMLDRAWLADAGLQFPDRGEYTVQSHDPAAYPLLFALVSIQRLAELSGDPVEFGRREAPVLAAIRNVAQDDPQEEVRARADWLLALLAGQPAAAAEDAASGGGSREP